jgi:hypothetical protein
MTHRNPMVIDPEGLSRFHFAFRGEARQLTLVPELVPAGSPNLD